MPPQDSGFVSIVDDDELMRGALQGLLKEAGLPARAFPSAEEFLNSAALNRSSCLIVDVRLPGMSGLDLQRQLVAAHSELPMVFISAHDDPVARRQALADGALAFLRKPFSEKALIDTIRSGLSHSEGESRANP